MSGSFRIYFFVISRVHWMHPCIRSCEQHVTTERKEPHVLYRTSIAEVSRYDIYCSRLPCSTQWRTDNSDTQMRHDRLSVNNRLPRGCRD